MRTVVFIGLMTIAQAINPSIFKGWEIGTSKFIAVVLFAAITMDIGEFIDRLGKGNK